MYASKFRALMTVPVVIFCYESWAIKRSGRRRVEALKWVFLRQIAGKRY
jgi:hypothetical protein